MNKKTMTMVTSLIVGGSLLAGTAYVNASQLSGYEAYKGAVMGTKSVKNGTAALKVAVTDNKKSLIDLSSNVKINLDSNALSSTTTVNSGSTKETFENFTQDGKNISYNSVKNEYTVFENKHNQLKEVDKVNSPQVEKSLSIIIDTLVGNMKDGVSAVSNEDGTKKVTIALNENQVTPLVNAVASLAFAGRNESAKHNDKVSTDNLKNVIPQLQSDIKIVSVNSTADINKGNVITDQVANVVLSGKDAAGNTHEIAINFNMDLSNINATTPDKVDLTGKQVKTITAKDRGNYRD